MLNRFFLTYKINLVLNDYDIFEKSLMPLIERAHDGKTTHCGKFPFRIPKDTKKQVKLSNLREQLDSAVQREDYEKAAKLRCAGSQKRGRQR